LRLIEQKSIKGTNNKVKVTIIDLKDKGPVITFLLNRIKLSAGQLSK
jgi:hypothetical protein